MNGSYDGITRRTALKKGAIVTGTLIVGGTAATGTAAAGIGEGRVGHYPLNNILPDGTVHDASPEGNHGTNYGAEVVNDGAVGNAFEFGGNGDHVYIGNIPGADGTKTLTLAAWIHPTETGQGDFFTKNTSGDRSNSSWVFRYDGKGNQTVSAHFNDDSDDWSFIRSDEKIPTGTFTHVAVTIDGQNRTLYIDGSAEKSDSYGKTLDNENAPVVLGAADQSGGGVTNEFVGLLDEVRVYDRALSDSEIQDLADMDED